MSEIINPGFMRVTEILSIFQAYAFVDKKKLKKAQDIGTEIHEHIKDYFQGLFSAISPSNFCYFESFLNWIRNADIRKVHMVEERLYDHYNKITGQIDLLAEIDGMTVLVDFKTGSWAHPEIWRLQGTLYRYLISYAVNNQERELPIPDHFLFVQLSPSGEMPAVFPMEFNPEDMKVCDAALRCYKYFKNEI